MNMLKNFSAVMQTETREIKSRMHVTKTSGLWSFTVRWWCN